MRNEKEKFGKTVTEKDLIGYAARTGETQGKNTSIVARFKLRLLVRDRSAGNPIAT